MNPCFRRVLSPDNTNQMTFNTKITSIPDAIPASRVLSTMPKLPLTLTLSHLIVDGLYISMPMYEMSVSMLVAITMVSDGDFRLDREILRAKNTPIKVSNDILSQEFLVLLQYLLPSKIVMMLSSIININSVCMPSVVDIPKAMIKAIVEAIYRLEIPNRVIRFCIVVLM